MSNRNKAFIEPTTDAVTDEKFDFVIGDLNTTVVLVGELDSDADEITFKHYDEETDTVGAVATDANGDAIVITNLFPQFSVYSSVHLAASKPASTAKSGLRVRGVN